MTSILNTALVEGLLETGQSDQGLLAVDEATALVEKNGDLFNKPELLRLKGSILLSKPRSDVVSAEQFYRESLELAGRLSARAWEVKAAMSLALLWMEQGRREEARGALAPVVDQFTEGFETLDLSRARRLLDRLE